KDSKIISIRCKDSLGIEKIKHLVDLVTKTNDGFSIRVYTIGAPRYRIEVVGNDPKDVSEKLTNVLSILVQEGKKEGLEVGESK
ncbi:translation initiation factor IF-2 subunit alpha, partial [Acidianus sp. DSM 29099]|nr:translation initiation factor IF-2 subunit alpha [Acidianus sp. RZ1]